jgi:hypothetical protein
MGTTRNGAGRDVGPSAVAIHAFQHVFMIPTDEGCEAFGIPPFLKLGMFGIKSALG